MYHVAQQLIPPPLHFLWIFEFNFLQSIQIMGFIRGTVVCVGSRVPVKLSNITTPFL